jgi:hypothetical protein
MCYNKEVSFVLFFFGLCCAINALKKDPVENSKSLYIGLYVLALSLMQANEFFLHLFKNPKKWSHQISAVMIPVTILIQMILMLICSIYMENIPEKSRPILIGMSATTVAITSSFIIFICVPVLFKFNKTGKGFASTMLCPEGCRLRWDTSDIAMKTSNILFNTNNVLYFITLAIITYYIFDITVTVIIFVLALLIYVYTLSATKSNSFGSLWCLMTLVIICVILINGP